MDIVFVVRQLQEKCHKQNSDLYTTFIDLTKALGTVDRNRHWEIMSNFSFPVKFVAIVQLFLDDMQASVQDDGEHLASFPMRNGVKQGCVLAPTLFSMVIAAVLSYAY